MAIVEIAKEGLSQIQNGRDYLDSLTNKYVMTPKSVKGIGGFVFDYEGETNVTLQAEITDHFAENNTAVQDHIAIKPVRITLHGFSAELVLNKVSGLLGAISSLQNKLTTVPAYLGHYTPQALSKVQAALTQTQNTVNKIDRAIARTKNVVGMFDRSSPAPTKQAVAYSKLESMFLTRQIFTVETPYKVFQNMAIESLSFSQDDTNKVVSDISITVKQLRFIDLTKWHATADFYGGRAQNQRQSLTDRGKTKGTESSLHSLVNSFQGTNG